MTRLVVLPHAGGAAHAYAPLQDALAKQAGGARIEAVLCELPGHGKRAREPLLTDFDAALADLLDRAVPRDGRPWAIFGHSMGAILGHALIRALRDRGLGLPEALFASGTVSPAARSRKIVSTLPKEAFWDEIRAYGGLPEEILQVADFRDFFEGILRSDFAVLESAPQPAPRPVPVPIVALYGEGEMAAAQAATWEWETNRSLETHGFPGGHFFLFDHIDAVARIVTRTLTRVEITAEAAHG
jgi:surfactin synthase thioesterase subunit